MRADSIAWERAAEVRAAAAGWLRAGAIDGPTATRIRAAHPDPCVTPTMVWRALTAAVVSAVLLCLLGGVALASLSGENGLKAVLVIFGLGAIVATEMLEASPALSRRGAAGATAFWGVALLLASLLVIIGDHGRLDDAIDWTLAAGAVAWAAACWRWGHPLFAGLAAVSLFALLARLPAGRLSWLAVGAALIGLAAPRLDDARWAPSHRRAAMVLLLAGIAAAYGAANLYSIDERLIEHMSRGSTPADVLPPWLLLAAAIATAAAPVAVLWWGLAARRTPLIDAGIVLAALSAATLRHYVHVAPLWIALALAGTALVGVAMRWSARSDGRRGARSPASPPSRCSPTSAARSRCRSSPPS